MAEVIEIRIKRPLKNVKILPIKSPYFT